MSIRRKAKTRFFVQIDRTALRNASLSLKAKGLLAVMMSTPEDWQFHMIWLEKQSRDGRESHQSAMKELEHNGYVVRTRAQNEKGKFVGWDYVVDDEVDEAVAISRKSPTDGFPVNRRNRQSGKPSDGKPATREREITESDLKKREEEKEGPSSAGESEAAKAPPLPGPFSTALEEISSSSLSPAALEAPDQAQSEAGNDAAPAQQASTKREGQSPNGEAAPLDAFTEEDLDDLLPLETGNDQAPQEVPGGAAAEVAASGGESRPLPARVLEFAPVPAPELESRLPALPASEPHQLLVNLLGEKDLLMMLGEKTRSGGLPRERWTLLHLAEIQAVETVATAEHTTTGTSLRTLIARGLDRLIGSPWTGQKKPAATSAPAIGGHSLEPAKKPELEVEVVQEGKLLPGAQYRRKADGVPVELVKTERVKNKFGDGEKWLLSDGSLVGAMDLVLKFEFVGRSA
ncbi:hypothetical protein EHF33_20585 (plasmid) [Deinococcus psychrotolerans]|uniref:Uncharacterized protein n=1 Tax=Deinococcus psychrotolerans TaxID=2489213 RepID=A0A3G8YJ73_9DEIO|nr:hypothetical protein [Deinococcus psychrotolerans]AZI45309.1 hypothetical protein EHF33_20585 [Deinococcus psychrotolerans]